MQIKLIYTKIKKVLNWALFWKWKFWKVGNFLLQFYRFVQMYLLLVSYAYFVSYRRHELQQQRHGKLMQR